jgi:hypothetical protein
MAAEQVFVVVEITFVDLSFSACETNHPKSNQIN